MDREWGSGDALLKGGREPKNHERGLSGWKVTGEGCTDHEHFEANANPNGGLHVTLQLARTGREIRWQRGKEPVAHAGNKE